MKILQNRRFYGKNEKGKIYKTCSKWCPFIRMQAWSRFLHSSMARQWLSARSLTTHQPRAVSARWCRECASAKHGLEDSPNSVIDWISVGVIRWPDVGRNEIRCGLAQILDGGTCTMGRCAELAQALVWESALVAMATVAAGTLLCE